MANVKVNGIADFTSLNTPQTGVYNDSKVHWYGYKIPLGDKALIVHYGEFHISQDSSTDELAFFWPYEDVTYGIGVCGMASGGKWSNGIYYDSHSTTTIKWGQRGANQWVSFVIIGWGAI